MNVRTITMDRVVEIAEHKFFCVDHRKEDYLNIAIDALLHDDPDMSIETFSKPAIRTAYALGFRAGVRCQYEIDHPPKRRGRPRKNRQPSTDN